MNFRICTRDAAAKTPDEIYGDVATAAAYNARW